MKNSKCVVCGTEFDAREGKLYCSSRCTQYSYRQKKKIQGEKDPEEIQEEKIKENILYVIDGYEYPKVKEKLKSFKPNNIVEYAFFRRNLSGIPNIDFIAEYIDSFFPFPGKIDSNNPFYDEDHTIYKSFKEFEQLFHEGRILIDFKPELIPDSNNTEE